MERITATYYIETPHPVEKAAQVLAGEQSSGTFVSVPGETEELKQRFAARVENIELLDSSEKPALGDNITGFDNFQRAKVRVSWSVENFGTNIPTLISTLQGNLYELKQFTGLKLDDFELPSTYKSTFQGPLFGSQGTKSLAGVDQHRPMIGTIIKPSIGMTPLETSHIVRTLCEAGIDFIKDDELLSSSANSPFEDRVKIIMEVINDHQAKTGRKVMYAFNITGDIETMEKNYATVVDSGGTACMISLNSVGWAGVKYISGKGKLSIHGHRNGWGMLNRHELLGINFPAYSKLWRLAGVDQLHVNGIQNKFWESDDSVVRSIQACSKEFIGLKKLLPVVSSGQWGGQAFETYKRTSTTELLYMAGGGILGHPMGATGGLRALQQAWEGAINGLSLEQTASLHSEFAQSVKKFS